MDRVLEGKTFLMKKSSKLSIIVPVFNEEQNITQNIELLIKEVSPFFNEYEVIIISDGSTDETNSKLREIQNEKIKIIFLEKNRGKGYSVRQGFFASQGEYILFIDGGMELHPKEIRIFLGLMELYDSDIVIASKRHPQSKLYYPVLRKILSFIYQRFIHFVFKLDVTDTQVGLKLFKRSVVDKIKNDLSIDRYGFDLELLALSQMYGFNNILEAPVRLDYFEKNVRSGLGELSHILKVGYSVLIDTYRVYIKIRKLKSKLNLNVKASL